jgi:hypothetical protein
MSPATAIPASYTQWRRCIEVDCAIPLTPAFVAARLAALGDAGSEEATRFVRLYGPAHWRNVLTWFGQAQQDLRHSGPV